MSSIQILFVCVCAVYFLFPLYLLIDTEISRYKKKQAINKSYFNGDIKMIQRAHLFNHAISMVEQQGGPDSLSSDYFKAFINCYEKGWGSR
jgi:hypothetical protein